jgi:putative component of toxin-antitoxin plasmid stabilization module
LQGLVTIGLARGFLPLNACVSLSDLPFFRDRVGRYPLFDPPLDARYPIGYNCDVFTVRQTQEFQEWLDALKDFRAQVRIAARLRLAEAGNLGDWKAVGGDVSEMRVDFGPGASTSRVAEGFSSSCSQAAISRRKHETSSELTGS